MRVLRIAAVASFGLVGWTAGSAVIASTASACSIAPATAVCAPDLLTISPSATLIATSSGPLVPSISPTRWTGSFTENVYRDPTNKYCANCLTWVVQVKNNPTSKDTIALVSIDDFSSALTDMGYINPPDTAPGMTQGTVKPDNVSRSMNGATLRWDFRGPEIAAGQTSVLLEVETNATRYVPGTITAQDGQSANGVGFSPQVPDVPWVPAVGLLGASAAGGYLFRKRRHTTA